VKKFSPGAKGGRGYRESFTAAPLHAVYFHLKIYQLLVTWRLSLASPSQTNRICKTLEIFFPPRRDEEGLQEGMPLTRKPKESKVIFETQHHRCGIFGLSKETNGN
jgi:hypothetical protein